MTDNRPESPINAALRQFEATEANLTKLERLWSEISDLTPAGLSFGSDATYEEKVRAYRDVLGALPAIDGWKPESTPMELNAIGQSRLDAKEVGEIGAEIYVEDAIEAPGRELAEYRHRLNSTRRQMVRGVMQDLIAEADDTLRALSKKIPAKGKPNRLVKWPEWERLKAQVKQIDVLMGSSMPRPPRWYDLSRHLNFGMMQDLSDIVRLDWPEVKNGLTEELYDRDDPIPVNTSDLATLAAIQPKGQVVTELKWTALSDEQFERLIFSLISTTPGYENPEWLMHTNAPDRGRDLSVFRVVEDKLGGTFRFRVLIQCKHWTSKSISIADVATLKEQMATWEPPRVDVLIIATTGRFTSDAVSSIEKHNAGDRSLKIEMWPESHIEKLLAARPALIAEFALR